jgi:RNA polymerase sigma-70 factor (ECF subfamily)
MKKSEFFTQISSLSKSLKPFAMNMTKSTEDTEDLIQDTMLRAITNFEKFQ